LGNNYQSKQEQRIIYLHRRKKLNLKAAVDEYIKERKADDISNTTKTIYRLYLNDLADFLGKIPLENLDKEKVQAFLEHQRSRQGKSGALSESTIRKFYSVIHTFSIWLKDQGYKEKSVTEMIKAPSVGERLPEILSNDEYKKLLADLSQNASHQTKLLFEFILQTGARLSEVVNLNLEDIKLEEGCVELSYPKRDRRTVLHSTSLVECLETYIKEHRNKVVKPGEKALFVTRRGTRYTNDGLSTIIRKRLKGVGVKGKCGINKLRNTFAVNYLEDGGMDWDLMKILGLKDVRSIMPYVHLANR
jgi:integrase/recombinase XerD